MEISAGLSQKRRRGANRVYNFSQEFDSLEHAKEYLDNQTDFVYERKYNTFDGSKINYKCRREACPNVIYVLCHTFNSKVSLFESNGDHEHLSSTTRGIDKDIKHEINSLFQKGLIYQVFVPHHEIEFDGAETGTTLRIFFSTKRLLSLTQNGAKHICSDATYKFLYLGFPILINGTIDCA